MPRFSKCINSKSMSYTQYSPPVHYVYHALFLGGGTPVNQIASAVQTAGTEDKAKWEDMDMSFVL